MSFCLKISLSASNITGVGVRQSPPKDVDDRSVLNVLSIVLVTKICSLDKYLLTTYCVSGTVLGAFLKLMLYHDNLSPKVCSATSISNLASKF